MSWRKINNIIHRDLGYLCFGLTIIYAISGVAVNHIADWNPSYRIEHIASRVDLRSVEKMTNEQVVANVLGQIGEQGKVKNSLWTDRETIKIFVEGNTVTANAGVLRRERIAFRASERTLCAKTDGPATRGFGTSLSDDSISRRTAIASPSAQMHRNKSRTTPSVRRLRRLLSDSEA